MSENGNYSGYSSGHAVEWHTSYWPFLISFGILFSIPLAFISFKVYGSPLLGVISLGIGVPLVLISIIGWVKDAMEDRHGYGAGHSVWAMPLFILSEALIFVAFFAAYWALRLGASAWPPAGTPEKNLAIPVIMTILLIASSFTIHVAERKVEPERYDHKAFCGWLAATMVLGGIFVMLSAYEWTLLFHEGFNFGTNIYSSAFYSLTGFHISHVIVGLGMFLCMFIPALKGRINVPFVKSASIYWHFVDVIWLFVVSQVYFW